MKKLDEGEISADSAPESQDVVSMKAVFKGFHDRVSEDALEKFWPNRKKAPELNGSGVTQAEVLKELRLNMKTHIMENLLLYDEIFEESRHSRKGFERVKKLALNSARGRAELIYDKLVALKMAGRDTLTGLPNRAVYKQNLKTAILRNERYTEPFSILYFDIDHFKNVNDSYGHDAGDKVLQELARRLTQGANLRELDVVVRFGGEEFVLILPTTKKEGACLVAQRISELISSKPFKIGENKKIPITVSIGVSEFTSKDEDPTGKKALKEADSCLYRLKHEEVVDGVKKSFRGHIACGGEVVTAEDLAEFQKLYPPRPSQAPHPSQPSAPQLA